MAGKVLIVAGVAVLVVGILVIALVVSSVKRLDSDEVAIKYNDFQKTLYEDPNYAGLHTGPPGFYFITFPSVFRTQEFSNIDCLNMDGVEVSLSISYQYRVRASALKDIVQQFRNYDKFKDMLTYVGESAIHDACSQFNTSQFQTQRSLFQEDLRQRLVDKYDHISTEVTDMQVNNVRRPYKYEHAIRKKETAKEDIVVARNERPQKETEAKTLQRNAETEAEIILAKANSNARIMYKQAEAERDSILNQFTEEAATYKRIVAADGLGLSSEELLSYVGVRMIQNAQSPITAGLKAPAKASYAP